MSAFNLFALGFLFLSFPPPDEDERGEPFADGTYFTDGYGWVE